MTSLLDISTRIREEAIFNSLNSMKQFRYIKNQLLTIHAVHYLSGKGHPLFFPRDAFEQGEDQHLTMRIPL